MITLLSRSLILGFRPASLTSLLGTSELVFPRISFDTITGIAIVNPASHNATVRLTAYGTDGSASAASSSNRSRHR